MQVLLPLDTYGLGAVEEKISNLNIQEEFEKSKFKEEVYVKLPKFKIEQTIKLTQHLKKMGLENIFSGVADFSGIDGTTQISVSEVVQKAFIEVNEEGSEAAAATAAIGAFRSKPPSFVANHPFIIYLRDKTTGMLLFQARVNNPLQ